MTQTQYQQTEEVSDLVPISPVTNLHSPRPSLNRNPVSQILNLGEGGKESAAVVNQEPSIHPQEISRLFPGESIPEVTPITKTVDSVPKPSSLVNRSEDTIELNGKEPSANVGDKNIDLSSVEERDDARKTLVDALMALFQEETVKNEKTLCEHGHRIVIAIAKVYINGFQGILKKSIKEVFTQESDKNVIPDDDDDDDVCALGNIGVILESFLEEENVQICKALIDHALRIVRATINFMRKEFVIMRKQGFARDGPLIKKLISSAFVEVAKRVMDSKRLLSWMISDHKYEESFTWALEKNDVSLLSWLCSEVDLSELLAMEPIPLSRDVLLRLLQQLDDNRFQDIVKKVLAKESDKNVQEETVKKEKILLIDHAENIVNETTDLMSKEFEETIKKGFDINGPVMKKIISSAITDIAQRVTVMELKAILWKLIFEEKYEESFTWALVRNDVSILSWLCLEVDLSEVLEMDPIPLSQDVLIRLLQQLALDIGNDSNLKLGWISDLFATINSLDPLVAVKALPVFRQVYDILNDHLTSPDSDVTATRDLMRHVFKDIRFCFQILNNL